LCVPLVSHLPEALVFELGVLMQLVAWLM
jgi:hypothetical protein